MTLQMEGEPAIPITVDVVWQIFSPYGIVEKIVIISKAGSAQGCSLEKSRKLN